MIKKSFYETPEAELILVRIEENFLASDPLYGSKDSAGTDLTEDPNYTYSY